ncbi:MAG: radical SAM protein [Candidatus Bathyarchaeia archaeon]
MCTLNVKEKKCLYKPRNLVIRKVDDFFLVLNPDVPNIMVVDNVGKKFFELCDGQLQADEIAEKLTQLESGVSKEELFDFISAMVKSRFLSWKPPPKLRKVRYSLYVLRDLYLHMTRACNLRCRHCYIEAGSPLESELTTEELLKLVEDFAQLGGERLLITGGEPLLRRESLYEIFRKARELDIKHIFMETNGTLISNRDIDAFKRYNVEIGVSLDGAAKETNDYIRGEGCYEKTTNAIKGLVHAGIKTKLGVTLMKPNIKEAEKIVLLAKDLGVSAISIKALIEMGRALGNKDLLLSPREVYSTILMMWRKARELGIATEFEDQLRSLEGLSRKDACGAGRGLLSISSDGYVYPCNMFLGIHKFNAGNIREHSLKDIWRNSKVLKTLRRISVLDIEGCRDCEMKFICEVCLASVYREHGNFGKKPRDCLFQKRILWILVEDLARKMWSENIISPT